MLGLSSCGRDRVHVHDFSNKDINEIYLSHKNDCTHSDAYFYSCVCGEHNDKTFSVNGPLGHSFNDKKVGKNTLRSEATHFEPATYFYSCSRCDEIGNDYFSFGETIKHEFNEKVIDDKYLSEEANCLSPRKYYYSCACGEHNIETFEYGDPLGHDYIVQANEKTLRSKADHHNKEALFWRSAVLQGKS